MQWHFERLRAVRRFQLTPGWVVAGAQVKGVGQVGAEVEIVLFDEHDI